MSGRRKRLRLSKGFSFKRGQTSNGIPVVVAENPNLSSYAFSINFGRGSTHQPLEKVADVHFLEHMLGTETPRWTQGETARRLEALGDENAGTDMDLMYVDMVGCSDDFIRAFNTVSRLIFEGVWSGRTVRDEKRVILNEAADELGQPDSVAMLVNQWFAHGRTAQGAPIIGTESLRWMAPVDSRLGVRDISTMTCKRLNELYYEMLASNNISVTAVGDMQLGKVVSLTEKYFGKLGVKKRPVLKTTKLEPVISLVPMDMEQTSIEFAFRVPSPRQGGAILSDMVAIAISGMSCSELFMRTRSKGLSYGVESNYFGNYNSALFTISTSCDNRDVAAMTREIVSHLKRLSERVISGRMLSLVKDKLVSDLAMASDAPVFLLSGLRDSVVHGLPPCSAMERLAQVDAVTQADVTGYIGQYLCPGNGVLSIVGDVKGLKLPSDVTDFISPSVLLMPRPGIR